MALFNRKVYICGLLVLFGSAIVRSEADSDDEGVTVETVEETEQYHSPNINSKNVYLSEHFDDEVAFKKKWIKSEAKKQGVDENIAKYDGKWEIQAPSRRILKDDLGLVLTTEAKHAAISALLDKPFEFKDKPLIVQYEVTMQVSSDVEYKYLCVWGGDQQTVWGRLLRATNYKPGLWAMYAVYCAIPVSIYIAYLVRRAREVNSI
ncbi:Calmegin [Papilio machaon]|uniref:Calmegin n=1 Tax=Papilio machaon TaxID=76193 RepID=A0A194REH2_PAPMA|nr:Calmegin [Papilio machaon]